MRCPLSPPIRLTPFVVLVLDLLGVDFAEECRICGNAIIVLCRDFSAFGTNIELGRGISIY
jgi:hypothetical protein